jgi:hypothetical protein
MSSARCSGIWPRRQRARRSPGTAGCSAPRADTTHVYMASPNMWHSRLRPALLASRQLRLR